jgi:hypothetical protein
VVSLTPALAVMVGDKNNNKATTFSIELIATLAPARAGTRLTKNKMSIQHDQLLIFQVLKPLLGLRSGFGTNLFPI